MLRREIGFIYPKSYTMGVDLGQAQDPTAILIVETETTVRCFYDGWSSEPQRKVERVEHRVRHAERLPLGMSYPDQVAHVRGLLRAPELPAAPELVIDMSGVGRPVFDLFEVEGLKPIGVVITGGLEEVRDGERVHRVPKILLVSRLQASLHAGELRFAVGLTEESALRQELGEFRMRHTEAGRLTFGAREGRHDDLVLGLAIAVWWAQQRSRGRGFSRSRLLGL